MSHFSTEVAVAVALGGCAVAYFVATTCLAKKSKAPMTDREIHLLRTTWAKVNGDLDAVAKLFYTNMFTDNPSFPKTLFRNVDMTAQGKKLMKMVGDGVALIDQPDTLIPVLQASGVRHVAYGCTSAQYDIVGANFIKTLRMGLGADFTPEVEAAWTKYYGIAASVMLGAADTPAGQALQPQADIRRRNWLVQESWELVTDADDFTKTFYGFLHGDNPQLKETQFKGVNMDDQRKKLGTMLDAGIKLLNRPDELIPVLKACGLRHVRYGTKPADYPLVGAALLKTLRLKLGAKFTPELEKEWTRVYTLMADTMIAGAERR